VRPTSHPASRSIAGRHGPHADRRERLDRLTDNDNLDTGGGAS
jgi:hypothetical protein